MKTGITFLQRLAARAVHAGRERLALASQRGQWLCHLAFATLVAASAAPARAALPSAAAPSTAPASGDWLGLIKGYGKDAGIVLGLLVAIAAFLWVSWSAIAKFNEARTGRAEWGEVGLLATAAGGVLVFDSYLLGVAAGII